MAERQRSQRFQDLLVWRKAHELVIALYCYVNGLPSREAYGLPILLKRAAVSVPANIAEGFERSGKADKARCMNIAAGSLEEALYYLVLAADLSYGKTDTLLNSLDEISRLLHAYSRAILSSVSCLPSS